ncbi:uncharacterized protein ACJ7VT_008689 isoform 1-T2 [Polymixia lowei]
MATYKMTDKDIKLLIKLRATNDVIFTGKRNSALRAWKAIRKEMGLQGQLRAVQLKKKWENLKKKYKELQNPPAGVEKCSKPNSWRWFHLMDQAMSGHLAGSARVLNPSLFDEDRREAPWPSEPACIGNEAVEGEVLETEAPGGQGTPTDCEEGLTVMTVTEEGDATGVSDSDDLTTINVGRYVSLETAELDRQIAELERERHILEEEQAEFDRERLILERERELLNRGVACVERDRAALENHRAAVDRERAVLERDRAVLEWDRAVLERDRAELLREKEASLLSRLSQNWSAAELEEDRMERRQRLLCLWERLIEKLSTSTNKTASV